jgi:hypothetical protein
MRAARGAPLAALLLACGPPAPEASELGATCAAITPTGAASAEATIRDTLELIVLLDSVPTGAGGVRLRVDGLAEAGLVTFTAPTPASAGAGITVVVPAAYHGCAGPAPHGLELAAPYAPRGKAWVRVSTDRTVRMRVRAGSHPVRVALADPGQSALVEWGVDAP